MIKTWPVAIFRRVSTSKQDNDNQLLLVKWAEDMRLTDSDGNEIRFKVVKDFAIQDSAWSSKQGKGREFDRQRQELLNGANKHEYRAVLVFAVDRLSRRGVSDTFNVIETLKLAGCQVRSYTEPQITLLNTATDEMMLAFKAIMAKDESAKRSERMKASIAARKAAGKPIGRGHARDKARRKQSGYYARWEAGGSRREAPPQERGEHGRFRAKDDDDDNRRVR